VRAEVSEIVRIDQLGHAGDGVTADGLFAPFTVPGDVVRIMRDGPRARVEELVQAGPGRVAPPCSHFGTCGGCALQHVKRESYLAWKRNLVETALRQRGFNDVAVDPVIAVPPGTRRRASLKAKHSGGGVQLGFYKRDSHSIVDVRECPIQVPQLQRLLAPLRAQLARLLNEGEAAELHLTALDGVDLSLKLKRPRDADLLSALAKFASALKLARLTWNGELVVQKEAPTLHIGMFQVMLPPEAFLQPTVEGENILQMLVAEGVAEAKRVADLFAGCGTFALALGETREVHAVESDAAMIAALAAASRGARITTEVRDLFARPLLPAELERFDAVVIDPPRPGAKAQAEMLAVARVPCVVYVSCNPASFARDARILAGSGYTLARVQPIDQFVWSAHTELVGFFGRK